MNLSAIFMRFESFLWRLVGIAMLAGSAVAKYFLGASQDVSILGSGFNIPGVIAGIGAALAVFAPSSRVSIVESVINAKKAISNDSNPSNPSGV